MKQRTISAIILLAVMVGSILIDSKVFGILILLCSILGFGEFFGIRYGDNKKLKLIKLFGIASLLFVAMKSKSS